MRNQETELQGQLQHLHKANTRINALMNQMQIKTDYMNIRNQGLAQQLQTSNLELSRLQTEVSSNQSTENRDAENLRNLREEHFSLAQENPRQSAEIERSNLSLQETEIETARVQSLWRDHSTMMCA